MSSYKSIVLNEKTDEYMNTKEIEIYMGMNYKVLKKKLALYNILPFECDISNMKNIPKFCSHMLVYKRKDIKKYKKDFNEFWDNHIPYSAVQEKYNKHVKLRATKIKVPPYFRFGNTKFVVSLTEINKILDTLEYDYISIEECCKILKLYPPNFAKVIKEFNLKKERIHKGKTNYCACEKSEIMKIKKMQDEFLKEILTPEEAYKQYGNKCLRNIGSHEVPTYAKNNDTFSGPHPKYLYYKKSELNNYDENKKLKYLTSNAFSDTNYNTYLLRLNHYNFDNFNNKPYTTNKWYSFIERRLNNIRGSEVHKNRNINDYVSATLILSNLLNSIRPNKSIEVYQLTTNEINLFLKSISKRLHTLFYLFFKEVSQDIKLDNVENKSRGFIFDKLITPYSNTNSSMDTEDTQLYTFNEYKKLFTFLTDIDFHLKKFSCINDDLLKTRYLSSWLFLSLQLTNAWRTVDIINFPSFNWDDILQDLGIYNIDWFYNNKISKEVGRKVITIISNSEFIISKTDRNNKFRASDEVCQTLTTILFMLDINYRHESTSTVYKEDKIMSFNVKFNHPDHNFFDFFFRDTCLHGFYFSNNKMTKTLLSFSKTINPYGFGILIAKNLRAHDELNSTIHYTKIPKDYIDFLSEHLFERGEFGYLYDSLVSIVIGDKHKFKYFEERTKLIKNIKQVFGDIHKVECTLKLSLFKSETDVVDMLYSKTLDECSKLLTDIHLNNLPSKESHIQCICSQSGCRHPERNLYPNGDGCLSCEYSIPNIYAIDILAKRLKEDLINYFSTSNNILKRKLSMRIFKYKEVIKSAIKKYGKDYIYSCIGIDMDRNEFMDSISKIENPFEINKCKFNKLLRGVNLNE